MDLSRVCIVCRSVAQLIHVLKTIEQDQDVLVLRYKNRLDQNYASETSGGYRDFSMNLKFTDQYEAQAVSTDKERWDGLVFEVQLIIEQMYKVKTAEGHDNYRKFRDLCVS